MGNAPCSALFCRKMGWLRAFISQVTKEDLYYRYFSEINLLHDDFANMTFKIGAHQHGKLRIDVIRVRNGTRDAEDLITQIDYDREMAFVAVLRADKGDEILGVTRAISDPDNVDAEFAVLVRSDLKGLGLGRRLLEKLISYTRDHGLLRLNGITMPNNRGMVTLARKLGFDVDIQLDEGIVALSLSLTSADKRE